MNEFKQPMYVWRDSKANRFSAPMVYTNEACAVRDFKMQIKGNGTSMAFAPADYDLYYIGQFDINSGICETVLPEFIVNGGSFSE